MYRRLLSLLSVSLVVATACAPSAAPTTPNAPTAASNSGAPAPTQKPAVEQKLTVGISNIVNTLDQHAQIGLNGRRYDIFDPLIMPDDYGVPKPGIATSWKTTDPTTWVFTIRTDMKFHDGTMLTAEDVKYSYDRAVDPARKLAMATRLSNLESTAAPDAKTVTVKTKQPDPLLLKRLMTVAIVPKAYTERVGDVEFGQKPIGTGPFKVKEWKPNDSLTLVAFDENPLRKPILRELTFRQIVEPSAKIAGLQTGDLDYIQLIPIDQADRVKQAGFELLISKGGASYGFTVDPVYNDGPVDGPTASKLVRQALNYAVDKEAIAKNVYKGLTKPEAQLAQETTFGYNPNLKPYPYDPKKAKELLAQAGYPNGFKTKIETYAAVAEGGAMALLIQQNLKDVGIEAEIANLEAAVWRDKFYNIQPRAPIYFVPLNNSPFWDADASIVWFWGKNESNRHYNNPEFNAAYEASRSELDPDKRKALLQKALAVMYEDPPFLWVVSSVGISAYNPKKVKGFVADAVEEQRYDRLEKIG